LTVPAAVFSTDASGLPDGLSTAQVVSIFAAAGLSITWSPAQSPVWIIDYHMDYGGQGAQVDPVLTAAGARNILKQANGNPVSYTLTFKHPVLSFQFRRAPLHAGTGVTNPPWSAVATATDGSQVAAVGEAEIRSFVDVPGRTFTLSGTARIAAVTFSGDDHQFDGQSNVVIDAMGWCP
jgi:hypothetical protein